MANKYSRYLRAAKKSVDYWRQVAVRDFTEGLLVRMRLRGYSQAELADRLKVKPAYISRILSGRDNLTLYTMAKLAMAAGGKVRVHIADQDAQTRFVDYYTTNNEIDFGSDEVQSLPSWQYSILGTSKDVGSNPFPGVASTGSG